MAEVLGTAAGKTVLKTALGQWREADAAKQNDTSTDMGGESSDSDVDDLEVERQRYEASRKRRQYEEDNAVNFTPAQESDPLKRPVQRVLEGAKRIGKQVFRRRGKPGNGDLETIHLDPNAPGPGWLNRLPRITSVGESQAKSFDPEYELMSTEEVPPGDLSLDEISGHLLRRQIFGDGDLLDHELLKPRRRRRRMSSPSTSDEPETAQERVRREKDLRGVDEIREIQRRRSEEGGSGETPVERRRREAALGIVRAQDNSDDGGRPRLSAWGFGGKNPEAAPDNSNGEAENDHPIRFTTGGAGRRLTKEDFLREIQSLDRKAPATIVIPPSSPPPSAASGREVIRNEKSSVTPGTEAKGNDPFRLLQREEPEDSFGSRREDREPQDRAGNQSSSVTRSTIRTDYHKGGDGMIVENKTVFRYKNLRKKLGVWRHKDEPGGESSKKSKTNHGPAVAYQVGNTVIVEDGDGEVIKTYELPPEPKATPSTPRPRVAAIAAALESQRRRDFLADPAPISMTGGSVAATQNRMAQRIHQFKDAFKDDLGAWRDESEGESLKKLKTKHGPALAYQIGNTTIIEDEDGEVVKTHELPPKPKTTTTTPKDDFGADSTQQTVSRTMAVDPSTGNLDSTCDPRALRDPDQRGDDFALVDDPTIWPTLDRDGQETMSDSIADEETAPTRTTTLEPGENYVDSVASSAWSDASSVATFDNASIFSSQSASTGQSSVYDPLGAAEDFIAILLSDAQLHPLFIVARSAIDSQTFKIELHQLLRRYSKDLYQEAQSPLDKVAINFIRRYRRRIAYAVSDDVYQINAKKTPGKSNKAEVIERYLQQLPGLRAAQDSDSSEDENDQEEPLSNLQRVKDFLVNSRAYENFRATIVQFILTETESPSTTMGSSSVSAANLDPLPSHELGAVAIAEAGFTKPPETEPSGIFPKGIKTPGSSLPGPELPADLENKIPGSFPQDHTGSIAAYSNPTRSELGFFKKLHHFFTRSFRPASRPGFQRIEWFCDCGTPLYGDFSGDDGEELEVLKGSLTGDRSRNPTGPSDSGNANDTELALMRSATASISSSNTGDISLQSTRSGRSSSATSVESQEGITLNSVPNGRVPKKYIALCVNRGGYYIGLGEIEASKISSDEGIFEQIRKKYFELRSFRARAMKLFLIQPVDIKFVKIAVEDSHRVDILSDTYPHNFPSKADVDNNRYTYSPCPLSTHPAIPSTAFLHYMSCTASLSTSKKWFNRLPKKLDKGLEEVRRSTCNEVDVVGWGVHIIEGPNAAAITLLTGIFMTICGIGSTVYSVVCEDVSGGFAIGAFVVALWAAWVAALFFHWKRQ